MTRTTSWAFVFALSALSACAEPKDCQEKRSKREEGGIGVHQDNPVAVAGFRVPDSNPGSGTGHGHGHG
jgi:hypothetical protein